MAQGVIDALRYGERSLGLSPLRAWVLLINQVPNQIHPEAQLSRIPKAIQNFSARQANAILGRTGQPFWQDESYDHWVRGPDELEKIVRYSEENPVAAGLVERVDSWRWSSAFGRSE